MFLVPGGASASPVGLTAISPLHQLGASCKSTGTRRARLRRGWGLKGRRPGPARPKASAGKLGLVQTGNRRTRQGHRREAYGQAPSPKRSCGHALYPSIFAGVVRRVKRRISPPLHLSHPIKHRYIRAKHPVAVVGFTSSKPAQASRSFRASGTGQVEIDPNRQGQRYLLIEPDMHEHPAHFRDIGWPHDPQAGDLVSPKAEPGKAGIVLQRERRDRWVADSCRRCVIAHARRGRAPSPGFQTPLRVRRHLPDFFDRDAIGAHQGDRDLIGKQFVERRLEPDRCPCSLLAPDQS